MTANEINMSTQPLFKDESYKILGACFAIYNEKGNGFLEAVYQECLSIEFEALGIPFEEQSPVSLFYRDKPLKQKYFPDFVCYEKIILELKVAKSIADEHRAQVINYLKSTNIQLGLLINFGNPKSVEYQRFVNQPKDSRVCA